RRVRKRQVADFLADAAASATFAAPLRETLVQQAEAAYAPLIPGDPEAVMGYATLLARKGQLSLALDAVDQLKEAVPVGRMAATGVQLLKLAEHDDAAEKRVAAWVDSARAADPNSLYVIHLDESLRRVREQYADAIKLNRKILSHLPDNVIACNNLAWLLSITSKQHDEALKLIQQAIDRVGPMSYLVDTRGMIQLEMGRWDAAIADFQTSWQQDRLPATQFHLAQALMASGDRESARFHLAAAVKNGLKVPDLETPEVERFHKLCEELGVARDEG
ncbi:MAG: hypothetical protein KF861_16570, partial [Planctomycetaceae bacterium]|nr:hypothetical protein [Planctomycetaceae bacterium]